MNSDKAKGSFKVGRADLRLDDIQRLQRDGFSSIDARSSGSAEAQLKLAGVNPGKNFLAKIPANQNDGCSRNEQIAGEHDPAQTDEALGKIAIPALKLRENIGRASLFVTAQHPDR